MRSAVLVPAVAAAAALASALPPSPVVERAATTICGQWGSVATGSYTVYEDLWGESSATSGSQCTTVDGLSGSTLSWSTSWTWEGGSSDVKSYANAVVGFTSRQLSSISSINTKWQWSYSGTSVVADVSYDMFTSSSASGSNEFEIMVWLGALGGACPISSTGSTIATPSIGGVVWNLYSGSNGYTTVYSFVASSAQSAFSGNLLKFLTYLVDHEGLPGSQYLRSIGAGMEAFTGYDVVFNVSSYSAAVK